MGSYIQQIASKMKLCLILIGLLAFSVCSIQAQEEDVVAEDLAAEEPAEIDGEIDSESDENSSSSSEEDDDDDDDSEEDDDDDDDDDEDTDGDGLVDDVDPDDDNDGILDDVDDDEDEDLEDIEAVATAEL